MLVRIQVEVQRLRELDEEQRKVLVARHHVEQEILTLKCPRHYDHLCQSFTV